MTLTGFTVLALLEAIELNVPNGKGDVPSSKSVYCSEVKMYLGKIVSQSFINSGDVLLYHTVYPSNPYKTIVLDSDKGINNALSNHGFDY